MLKHEFSTLKRPIYSRLESVLLPFAEKPDRKMLSSIKRNNSSTRVPKRMRLAASSFESSVTAACWIYTSTWRLTAGAGTVCRVPPINGLQSQSSHLERHLARSWEIMQPAEPQHNVPRARDRGNRESPHPADADISTPSATDLPEMAVPEERNTHIQKAQVKCVQGHCELWVFIKTAEITLFFPSFRTNSFLC